MLPLFVGFVIWVTLGSVAALMVMLASRWLRPLSGFIFLIPTLGVAAGFLGFLAVGWLLDKRVRPELAATLAFYLGFLLCGACGSVVGFLSGWMIWNRLRRRESARIARDG